jgi:hypothetical protein
VVLSVFPVPIIIIKKYKHGCHTSLIDYAEAFRKGVKLEEGPTQNHARKCNIQAIRYML